MVDITEILLWLNGNYGGKVITGIVFILQSAVFDAEVQVDIKNVTDCDDLCQ